MSALHQLAERVARGDAAALAEWQQTFPVQMARIVRRTLRAGTAVDGFARRILAVADRTGASPGASDGSVDRVTQAICAAVLDHLRAGRVPGSWLGDTLRDGADLPSVVASHRASGPPAVDGQNRKS